MASAAVPALSDTADAAVGNGVATGGDKAMMAAPAAGGQDLQGPPRGAPQGWWVGWLDWVKLMKFLVDSVNLGGVEVAEVGGLGFATSEV